MNNSSQQPWSEKYDLTVANVEQWRKQRPVGAVWTQRRTRIWNEMRTRGEQAARKPDNYAERWTTIGDCIVATVLVVGVALLFEVVYQVATAFLSGRVQEVLDQITRSHR
jgi:hypothetical protein